MKTRRRMHLERRLRHWLRRVARIAVAVAVVLSLIGANASIAAAALAHSRPSTPCACPHSEGERKACPCCNHDDDGSTNCLPMGDGCSSQAALAPAIASGDLIPLPVLVGLADEREVLSLHGQSPHLRLERPPRQ